MTKTSNLQIDVIRQVVGCDKQDAEDIRRYIEDHSPKAPGKMKLSEFASYAIKAHLILMFPKHQQN